MQPDSGGTTVEDCSSHPSSVRGSSQYCVHWVHPEERLTPLPNERMRERLVFGRDAECDVVLAGQQVSRQHATLQREGVHVVLRDLKSRNGTYVDGRPVLSRVLLSVGHVLRLGDWIGILASIPDNGAWTVPPTVGLMVGPTLGAALAPAFRVATSQLPIIVEGETGTGKENVARAIHQWSKRTGPFVAVNCGALPEHLAEGELFGYRRGAFTGADRASDGYFRTAEGGSLLLDELLDLPAPIQTKLLRTLEQREVVPLGESLPKKIDVRVIAAAQIPLSKAVEEGRIRADLYARLNGLTVRLPPLRERRDEVPALFRDYLARERNRSAPRLEPRLVEQLCLYSWPLNVRELVLLAQRMHALCANAEEPLRFKDLPEHIRLAAPAERVPLELDLADVPADERDDTDWDRLVDALRATAGNLARASSQVGISRQRAYRLLEAHPDVKLESFRNLTDAET